MLVNNLYCKLFSVRGTTLDVILPDSFTNSFVVSVAFVIHPSGLIMHTLGSAGN